MRFSGNSAADVGIQRCKAMDQAKLLKKIECTVYRWRCRTAFFLEKFKQFVGADRFMLSPNQLQDLTAKVGKPLMMALTDLFRIAQGLGDTILMIVVLADKLSGQLFFHSILMVCSLCYVIL